MKKFSRGRALLVFKVASVYQAWADRFLTRGPWLGRYLMKKRLLIASALCSSTGHLCNTLDQHCILLDCIIFWPWKPWILRTEGC